MKKKIKTPSLKEIEANFENWKPVSAERKQQTIARNMKARALKDATINQRVNSADLHALREIADKKGIKYQTLLGSMIHQYVTGQLVDVEEVRKVLEVPNKRASGEK